MLDSIVNMHVGGAGAGKTHLSCTFPKFYMVATEPNNHWVWKLNPHYNSSYTPTYSPRV